MMLRYSTPGSVRLVDLGPASPAPLRGHSHRLHVPSGSLALPRSDAAAARESQRRYVAANRELVNDRKRAARKAAAA